MQRIYSSVSCNLDHHILQANLPLFENGEIQAIEWSFDAISNVETVPDWFRELLQQFSRNNRLIGHGVFFSLFSGKFSKDQADWLKNLRKLSEEFKFDHVSEHFGFMTGEDFHKGAPLGIPLNQSTLNLGTDRLKRMQDACQCIAGIENLAFSYTLDEVKKQGELIDKLLQAVNGFLILDLHNLYCQIRNFNIDFQTAIQLFPLERVWEIHISGGSWSSVLSDPFKLIRRDTHDDEVPAEVFIYLEKALKLCPSLKFVVLEQVASGLNTKENILSFQSDFRHMTSLINSAEPMTEAAQSFLPIENKLSVDPVEDALLASQQEELSLILENSSSLKTARYLLSVSRLANTDWKTESWNDAMLETAMAIAQKWKHGLQP